MFQSPLELKRRQWNGRLILLLLTIVGMTALHSHARAADIRWDLWGVPHIWAESDEDAAHAFGWAQMRANADEVLRLYARARGQAAQFFGPGADRMEIKSDTWVLMMGVPELAETWWLAQTPSEKAIIEAFTAGMNEFAASSDASIDGAARKLLPIRPQDVLAHLANTLLYGFVVDPWRVEYDSTAWTAGRLKTNKAERDGFHQETPFGSNAWAISPKNSVSGNAMLMINPHLPWSGETRWFEVELASDAFALHGVALVGLPFIAIGFNRHLGWSHTVNPMHGYYLYELNTEEDGYAWDGGTRPFVTRKRVIQVRQPDGSETAVEVTFRDSVHGPVVARQDGRALALWVVGRDAPHLIGQYWRMAKSKTFEEFLSALKMQQMPMFSLTYADRDGHIFFDFGGRHPAEGPIDQRSQTLLPGTSAKTLWRGILPFDHLPQVLDPPNGWVQNANDPPWTATFPSVLKPEDFPSGLTTEDTTNLRAQQLIRALDRDHH
ncbi:MAG: hypothetical protein HC869_01425 [Rhodospirillales bacterium]|nr:hypothetical protein [Rhodospirillales bacterium]